MLVTSAATISSTHTPDTAQSITFIIAPQKLSSRKPLHDLSLTWHGIVGKHYDDHINLLKRQVAAAEYIWLLKADKEVINIDESILRSTDQRTRGWVR